MAALGSFAFRRIRLLRCRASLGIHVESSNLNLRWVEMVHLVENPKPGSAHGLAFRGIPFGLARNGCAVLLG